VLLFGGLLCGRSVAGDKFVVICDMLSVTAVVVVVDGVDVACGVDCAVGVVVDVAVYCIPIVFYVGCVAVVIAAGVGGCVVLMIPRAIRLICDGYFRLQLLCYFFYVTGVDVAIGVCVIVVALRVCMVGYACVYDGCICVCRCYMLC